MYAVIETGGKQYRVEVGTELEVETLDVEPGKSITLDRVLLVADGDDASIGRPVVADAAVEAEVVRHDRGDKVIVFKYRPKARRRVKKGHRQEQTILRITDVRLGDRSAAEQMRERERAAQSERDRLEEAARRQAAADAALAEQLATKSGRGKGETKDASAGGNQKKDQKKESTSARGKADATGDSSAARASGGRSSTPKSSAKGSAEGSGGRKTTPKSDAGRPKTERRKDT
jgi:large subunit ribosomal protein L21